jgi:hypothetical protein
MPRTKFRPETDGYAFKNQWAYDNTELATLTNLITDAVDAIEVVLSPIITAAVAPLVVAEAGVPFIGPWLVAETIGKANEAIVNGIVDAIQPGGFGLCGGMAFSAYDYFLKGWALPRGNGPTDQPQRTSPSGSALRDYIWSRLIDSVRDNAATFLQWMAVLHFEGGPGATWLRDQTGVQLDILRARIDGGAPVTLGLVGTTWNPLDNHQVLCYGYSGNGDGTTTLFLYDNNAPGVESTTRLDFSGSELSAIESSKGPRGELRGLFCTSYAPKTPPKAVVLHAGVTLARPDTGLNQPVGLQLSAANDFYHNSPSLRLTVVSDLGSVVQEPSSNPIAEAGSRSFSSQLTFNVPGKHHVTVVADLGAPAGFDITKQLPPEGVMQSPTATLTVFGDRYIGPANFKMCDVYNVIGTTVTYEVDVSDMGPGATIEWTVTGAVVEGSSTSKQVTLKLPNYPGALVNVKVKVSLPDGTVSTGSDSLGTITPIAGVLQEMMCRVSQLTSALQHKPPDPDPGMFVLVNPEELTAVGSVATNLAEAANTALKSKEPVLITPGRVPTPAAKAQIR